MWDLTHEIGSGLRYPGDPQASMTPHATFEADGYRVAEVACSTHSGTHVDAPAHLLADGATLGAYDVETFAFDARTVDCTAFGAREPIPADRVPDTDADLVVFRTGWSEHWGDQRYFDHPYLTTSAAARCAALDCHVGLRACDGRRADGLSGSPRAARRRATDSRESTEPRRAPTAMHDSRVPVARGRGRRARASGRRRLGLVGGAAVLDEPGLERNPAEHADEQNRREDDEPPQRVQPPDEQEDDVRDAE